VIKVLVLRRVFAGSHGRAVGSRCGRAGNRLSGGLGRAFQRMSKNVTLLMHRFSTIIGFAGFKIDRLVAYRAIEFGLLGTRHFKDTSATSEGYITCRA
jgi:hypothetical protein